MTIQAKVTGDGLEELQRLRVRRTLIGSLSYLVTFALVLAFWYLGHYGIDVVRNFALATIILVTTFYALIKTNINLRFADPSMTLAQVALSIGPAYYVMFHSQQLRPVVLVLVISSAMYGLFRFRMRDFLILSFIEIGGYAVMIVLLYHYAPAEINLPVELLQWFALTATVLQFSGLGGLITSLRNKVKSRNDELAMRNGELVEALQRIEELAMRDELTGVFNRRYLMEAIRHECLRCERSGDSFTLCILDVDHFKRVNDMHGHLVGDQVLQHIARSAAAALRQTDVFGRYGGEEFAMLLTATASEGASVTAERVRRRIEQADLSAISAGLQVTVSIGIADFQKGEEAAQTFKRADQALYLAKASGRNCCITAPSPALSGSIALA